MTALLFAIPVLIFYFLFKKRGPNQKELGFWILFLIPFGIMGTLWLENESINKLWWAYIFLWILALATLIEGRIKKIHK